MAKDTKGGKVTNSCGCKPSNAPMHKLMAMGMKPPVSKPSPKTPA